MSNKTYIVAVTGIIKRNGQLAKFGTEVKPDELTRNAGDMLEQGYITLKGDFEKEQKEAEKEVKEAEKEEAKSEETKEEANKNSGKPHGQGKKLI